MTDTPKKLGFHMPAEWEEHSAIWLAWPHDKISFPKLGKVENDIVKIIATISPHEQVELLVLNEDMKIKAEGMLKQAAVDLNKITFHIVDYMDAWMRDCGPCFLKNPETYEQAWVKWTYNVYGEKFPDLLKDNEVMLKLRGKINARMFEPEIVMEGGAIEVNGQGTLITTEQCLLSPNRNPSLDKEKIEKYLRDYLGVSKIIWLKQGLFNDHTDGHIDDVAKFVSANKILCAYEENPEDENYAILQDCYQTLTKTTDINNKPFEVIKLPMAHLQYSQDKPFEAGQKAAASYTNFYIGNEVVLAPTYNDLNDAKALEIIQSCFPDRKVVGIDCSDIIYGGGAIHCLTQQQPAI
jgi:agmatine deiminase